MTWQDLRVGCQETMVCQSVGCKNNGTPIIETVGPAHGRSLISRAMWACDPIWTEHMTKMPKRQEYMSCAVNNGQPESQPFLSICVFAHERAEVNERLFFSFHWAPKMVWAYDRMGLGLKYEVTPLQGAIISWAQVWPHWICGHSIPTMRLPYHLPFLLLNPKSSYPYILPNQ